MQTLAIHGGSPIRESTIFDGLQWIDETDIEAVCKVLRGNLITCGPKVTEFEKTFAEYTNAQYTVAVNSGTSALHCACIAADIHSGDEVITTPLTFAASANCILYCNGVPVFADIDPKTYNIDPESIESHITDKTKAVIAVDYAGQAVNHTQIRKICDKHHLIFIEDAAHAIGTLYQEKPIGSLADMTCFSFHPVKTITSGEGGAITTNDPVFYNKLLCAHAHGIIHETKELLDNLQEGHWYYEQISLGYNYRITDFQAALLNNQLSRLEYFKQRRAEITDQYNKAFRDLEGIIIPKEIPESNTCRHLYVVQLDLEKLTCTRRQFYDALSAEHIQPQVHYIPVYWFPYYQKLGYQKGLCPIAENLYQKIISIPLYPKMTDQDVQDVIDAVTKITTYYQKRF